MNLPKKRRKFEQKQAYKAANYLFFVMKLGQYAMNLSRLVSIAILFVLGAMQG
jgi:hypothetical protein